MTKTTPDSDQPLEELMHLAQNGDKHAYSMLFRMITPIIRSFISGRINNPEDVNDIVQEILISIHRASHTYDTDRPFKSWMFAIARYRLNDHLRKHYQSKDIKKVNYDDISHMIADKKNVTETYEDHEYLNELMKSLPLKQRKIVTLMKIEGHTAEEVAQTMDMSVSAVKVSAHRAYKAMALKAEKETG